MDICRGIKEMKEHTKRQKKVLDTIVKYALKNQDFPTYRDLSDTLGITVKGVYDHVNALKKKGYIESDMRTIRPKCLKIVKVNDNDT